MPVISLRWVLSDTHTSHIVKSVFEVSTRPMVDHHLGGSMLKGKTNRGDKYLYHLLKLFNIDVKSHDQFVEKI